MRKVICTPEAVFKEYQKGLDFKTQIGLFETVRKNEKFFIGDQWHGVQANGLPTPTHNFLKTVTLFIVSSITSDNIKLTATPFTGGDKETQLAVDVVNREFDRLMEFNKIGSLIREFMRNAAVDGDACLYTYFDPDIETGQAAKGAIVTEIMENTRVFFGNPNDRRVQKQPHIIIAVRELVDDVKEKAEKYGSPDVDLIMPDDEEYGSDRSRLTDDKVTVLLKMWKDKETGTIHAYECTKDAEVRPEWDLGIKLYPIVWMSWDYMQDSYHGQALITGLIPNQVFLNKTIAMTYLSLMTMAYPKVIYDATRVKRWTNQIGTAIPVNGSINDVAKIMDGAQLDPQITQFIKMCEEDTKSNLGATPAALGQTRPDNTSAIIALQRAAAVPSELTKQNLYQCIEDLGRIYLEYMAENYGIRFVEVKIDEEITNFAGMPADSTGFIPYDFSQLKKIPMSLKLDVGASAYWSEIAAQQTMDNLLMLNHPDFYLEDYLERVTNIPKQQELIAAVKQRHQERMKLERIKMGLPPEIPIGGEGSQQQHENPEEVKSVAPANPESIDVTGGAGYGRLQRAINETGLALR